MEEESKPTGGIFLILMWQGLIGLSYLTQAWATAGELYQAVLSGDVPLLTLLQLSLSVVVGAIIGVVGLLVCLGLLASREWARKTAIAYSAVMLLLGTLGPVLAGGGSIWYLLRKEVAASFKPAAATPTNDESLVAGFQRLQRLWRSQQS